MSAPSADWIDTCLETVRAHFDRCVEACQNYAGPLWSIDVQTPRKPSCDNINWALTVVGQPRVGGRHRYNETNGGMLAKCKQAAKTMFRDTHANKLSRLPLCG